jgi:ABC-type branched-subunit amino acid transport system ATPase component
MIVEQKIKEALAIAHTAYALRSGLVTFCGPAAELLDPETLRSVYL